MNQAEKITISSSHLRHLPDALRVDENGNPLESIEPAVLVEFAANERETERILRVLELELRNKATQIFFIHQSLGKLEKSTNNLTRENIIAAVQELLNYESSIIKSAQNIEAIVRCLNLIESANQDAIASQQKSLLNSTSLRHIALMRKEFKRTQGVLSSTREESETTYRTSRKKIMKFLSESEN